MTSGALHVVAVSLPGGWELLVILFIVLLLFGAKRLPDLAGSLGRSVRELRRAASDDEGTTKGANGGPDQADERDGGADDR